MNPIMQIVQAIRNAQNPGQMLMRMSRQNPGLHQVMQMVNGKTPQEMRSMVQQAAQQRGVNLEQLAQSIGIRLPE